MSVIYRVQASKWSGFKKKKRDYIRFPQWDDAVSVRG